MKFSFAAVASLLASVAYSQTIASEVAQIPSCALSCLTTAITGAGCGLTDYACQCGSSKDAITKAATPCVVSSCSTSDALKVQSVVSEICTIQSGSGGGSSSAASVASSTATTTSPAAYPTTSNVSMIGSFMTTATSAAAGVTTTAASSPSASTSASTSAPAQVSSSPGNRLQAGGVVAGAAALLAFVL